MTQLTTLADAYGLDRVRAAPAGGVDFMAQIAAFEERQRVHPERAHWSPVDQTDPGDDGPAEVLDGDLDRWRRLRTGPNQGLWRMVDFHPGRHEARAGEPLPWQQLAFHYGPLTDAASERK
ncbi:hypothetical protein HHL19_35675 [Streptomyces sp. R302]|uniref:hypothetical protein n=1 Tax=unclassified Streptomyces TaxID=2593676 RepID=UPI00145E7B4D|nr:MULTISPECIES: hypothetical protein [unclassified Streptomyces]NML55120.1 hypothetical protein [Streptomyces sp. R301]NML83850.1 hypothetical protein [Streptomyces sp. R302]